jgi:topoisomerase-4 subunit A
MVSRQRAGKQFITVEQGDAMARPVPLFEGAVDLALLSAKGKFLVFGLDEVKALSGGGRGTILLGLDDDDRLAQCVPVSVLGLRVAGIYRTRPAEDILAGAHLAAYRGKRARKGKQLDVRVKGPVLSPVM